MGCASGLWLSLQSGSAQRRQIQSRLRGRYCHPSPPLPPVVSLIHAVGGSQRKRPGFFLEKEYSRYQGRGNSQTASLGAIFGEQYWAFVCMLMECIILVQKVSTPMTLQSANHCSKCPFIKGHCIHLHRRTVHILGLGTEVQMSPK